MNTTPEEKIYDFLISCHRVFYLATSENGIPDVRPFGAVILYNGHAVFCTGRDKRVFRQMTENPNIAVCACLKGEKWLRVSGTACFIDDGEALDAMLALEDRLRSKYGSTGEGLALFRICQARAVFSQRGAEDEVYRF